MLNNRNHYCNVWQKAEAELATLRDKLKDHEDDWKRIQDAERERDRYKAALEKIASDSYATCETQIAREALGE